MSFALNRGVGSKILDVSTRQLFSATWQRLVFLSSAHSGFSEISISEGKRVGTCYLSHDTWECHAVIKSCMLNVDQWEQCHNTIS